MTLFMLLIVPLPFTIRRKMFTFMYAQTLLSQIACLQPYRSESPLVAKLQYGMKITFIFILILFIDSVNRVYRVQVELAESNKNQGGYVSLSHLTPET
jgi:B-cell receptor-associated protein 31